VCEKKRTKGKWKGSAEPAYGGSNRKMTQAIVFYPALETDNSVKDSKRANLEKKKI